jgi:hypothetical protein
MLITINYYVFSKYCEQRHIINSTALTVIDATNNMRKTTNTIDNTLFLLQNTLDKLVPDVP